MNQISRREFVSLTATGIAGTPLAWTQHPAGAPITAHQIVDRIRKGAGVEWKTETVDTFKAGDPSTAARGIVTTAMATMDVLERAVKAGANVVITCEPTFYGRADTPTPPARRGGPGAGGRGGPGGRGAAGLSTPAADPVFSAKDGFIKRHGLVVFRFSEHWRLRKPDPLAGGLTEALGWSKFRSAGDPAHAAIPEMRLDALASHIKTALNARGGMRVIGEPGTRVRRIGVLPGSTPLQASLNMLPAVDAIVAGEVREWESVEYVRDAVAAGGKKGLILLGRIVSEEPGMRVCAQWLQTIVPELATTWVPVGDPYWRPL